MTYLWGLFCRWCHCLYRLHAYEDVYIDDRHAYVGCKDCKEVFFVTDDEDERDAVCFTMILMEGDAREDPVADSSGEPPDRKEARTGN
jgi:hypothetical protein